MDLTPERTEKLLEGVDRLNVMIADIDAAAQVDCERTIAFFESLDEKTAAPLPAIPPQALPRAFSLTKDIKGRARQGLCCFYEIQIFAPKTETPGILDELCGYGEIIEQNDGAGALRVLFATILGADLVGGRGHYPDEAYYRAEGREKPSASSVHPCGPAGGRGSSGA